VWIHRTGEARFNNFIYFEIGVESRGDQHQSFVSADLSLSLFSSALANIDHGGNVETGFLLKHPSHVRSINPKSCHYYEVQESIFRAPGSEV
jgi:hypothetical protein